MPFSIETPARVRLLRHLPLLVDGNAVWPVAMMAALSLPIASDLTRGRWLRAGLAIGAAILMKQTAAYLLVVVAVVLVARRSFRAVVPVLAGAALPYAAVLGAFALSGAAGEMIRWTVLVPFQVQDVTFAPDVFTLGILAFCFLPTIAAAALEKTPRDPSASWLLAVAPGFTLLCYPNFMMLQTVAALPCLAVGAARLLEILPSRVSGWVAVCLFVFTLSRASILVAGAPLDGRVLYWNEDTRGSIGISGSRTYANASFWPPASPARFGLAIVRPFPAERESGHSRSNKSEPRATRLTGDRSGVGFLAIRRLLPIASGCQAARV